MAQDAVYLSFVLSCPSWVTQLVIQLPRALLFSSVKWEHITLPVSQGCQENKLNILYRSALKAKSFQNMFWH